MLPKQYRLKKKAAFSATYRTNTVFRKHGIVVFCGKVKKDNFFTKIGFVVSKKIHKRAVKRNRIKRLMRESIRLYIKKNDGIFDCKYMSLIFTASNKLLGKNFNEINLGMKTLMEIIKND